MSTQERPVSPSWPALNLEAEENLSKKLFQTAVYLMAVLFINQMYANRMLKAMCIAKGKKKNNIRFLPER